MQFSVSAILACTLASVPAVLGAFTINSPVDATVWTVGKRETITWIPADGGFDSSATWPVSVMFGNHSALTMAGTVGQAKETDGTFSFTVPTSWGNSKDYAVRIGNPYSHYFTIQGSDKDAVVPTSTTSSSTTSSTPTSSSSSTPSSTSSSKPTSSDPQAAASNMSPQGVSAGSVVAFVPFALLALSWF
ncbi:hypothetical protein BJ684DRAFT_20612 [Piptocephalis cylindrospora]|uniref:Yeast cell wall synthesis Kre9/Knh1-like N-terminal domain-containing protein n=1 Tax=Piptocephalis cylindrospora TaxID=1907219 RepID=A0A4P9Y221_9FUNG|nr:hypothetical protein BJ684DRAFT_20612 [Piptocephalis cylindrospora]|eukprot:RKP12867.1 hypothetical protein BJ684DRAFT_20612 [Piptocephalis cylindrospora]